jgi:hypothetical protein
MRHLRLSWATTIGIGNVVFALVIVASLWLGGALGLSAGEPGNPEVAPAAVAASNYELMAYLFGVPFERLVEQLKEEPAGRSAWTGVKSDSLILAEAANLLILRPPQEGEPSWKTRSAAVRQAGSELYEAAKKRDYPKARQQFEAMARSCNACHEQFAHGFKLDF